MTTLYQETSVVNLMMRCDEVAPVWWTPVDLGMQALRRSSHGQADARLSAGVSRRSGPVGTQQRHEEKRDCAGIRRLGVSLEALRHGLRQAELRVVCNATGTITKRSTADPAERVDHNADQSPDEPARHSATRLTTKLTTERLDSRRRVRTERTNNRGVQRRGRRRWTAVDTPPWAPKPQVAAPCLLAPRARKTGGGTLLLWLMQQAKAVLSELWPAAFASTPSGRPPA